MPRPPVGHSRLSAEDEQYITLRRTLDEAVERYEDLFELAPVGLMSLDENGVVREVNTAMCGLLGRDPHLLLDGPLITKVHVEDQRVFLDQLRRGRRGEVTTRCHVRFVRRDGHVTPSEVVLQRSRLDGKTMLRVVVLDLTEQQRHEQERVASEIERERFKREEEIARRANQAKDRFLAVLSHELRTPVTPVMFALARLATIPGLPPAAVPLVDLITRNLDLERQLIDDLLDMNRIANGKLVLTREPLDVHDIVRDALGVIEIDLHGRGLTTTIALDALESTILGDANRLRQVFWNLLANAVKFTETGGHVSIESRNERSGSLVVAVTDTGVGIDPDRLPLLFEPFEQAHRGDAAIGGLGLGLSICKGVIEAHAGRISAKSAGAGQGTTFELELPVLRSVTVNADAS